MQGFFGQWYSGSFVYLPVDLLSIINGLFLVAAVLISFGAVIGRDVDG